MAETFPADLAYTAEHEWYRRSDGRVGITDFAQAALGDVVFVELPAVGSAVTAGAVFGTVESVKSVSDLFAPVGGTVTAVNEDLAAHPERVNTDPYGEGWLVRVAVDGTTATLLSAEAYRDQVAGGQA